MKFREIFRFEFAYQVRRPWPWLFVIVLLVLDFLMTRDGSVSEVLYSEFFLNSPFGIAKTTVFGSLIWLVLAAPIAGDAAARDVATGMYPLIYTTSISKAEYLGGRFLAALVLNALILLAVQAGILLGVYLPGVDAELIGPFRPAAFLTAYAYIALPTAFAATAIQFFMAARSGRAMGAYFGSFLIVFMSFFVASFLLFGKGLGTLLDPIGIRFVVEDIAHMWTPIEKNRRLIGLEGIVLTNRLLWIIIGLLGLIITYLSFRFAHRTGITSWRRIRQLFTPSKSATAKVQTPIPAAPGILAIKPVSVPQVQRSSNFITDTHQMFAIAWASFLSIVTSWAGLFLLAFIPLLTIPVVLDQMESKSNPLVPTTIRVISELTASLADELSRWVIIPFLIVFFAGELVWREREARMGEITDTMPGSAWAPFLGKFLGLALLLVVFLTLQIGAGMVAQVIMGYHNFEIGLYLKIMFGLQLTDYLLFALLGLVVHVVVNQKYIGHLVAIIAFVFIALASLFGVEHNMLIYGASPGWSYTEMRGFEPSIGPWLWFKSYWVAWALLLAVTARLLWVRGRETSFPVRLRLARQRLTRTTVWTAGLAVGLILTLGGFIFYNTNVLNEYHTASEMKERAAAYEQSYGQYSDTPQPQLAATKLNIEIYPERRAVDIIGTYHLVNHNKKAIDSIHVTTVPGVETVSIEFDRPAKQVLTDERYYHRTYALDKPLMPGDTVQLTFQVKVEPRGFRENGIDALVVANGTRFTNSWLPAIGYQKSRELIHASDRREYGFEPRPVIASLYDRKAREDKGTGGGTLEAVIGTASDQVAVAPGALRRTWTKAPQSGSGQVRRYFHYSTDGSAGGEWGFFSANYTVLKEQWKAPDSSGLPVTIQIFHNPQHAAHLDRMVRSIRNSLEYYTREFGPYPRGYLSVVEGAGNGTGMHAEGGMLTYAEGFALWHPKDTPESLDFPSAVVAHEMAHQWTVPYANVEGAPVMSESLAWYYAIKAVENARGHEERQRLLDFLRVSQIRPEIRRGEPLLRGLDPYMSYRKGPFALYTLSEYLGEKKVNGALRRLVENHRKQGAPLATTLDLYRELKAVTPDSLQYLLHDLFEVNTYWEFKIDGATAKQTVAGSWEVTLDLQARKLVADSAGVEKEIPTNDWVEIGIREQGKESGKPLYRQKHRIRSGKQTLTLKVPHKPDLIVIDPRQLLIEEKTDDNRKEIKL
ncbi:ABC transporter permease/M1 family aminopeptidase [Telluribacter humicola]|uniref:ABC transporter permease/M1 family aminopeptidase n=1 Tax=Telluribacter humicola TaxID=1720261 RepID=UPI001A962538|nr:hypothetical protein [Telluribacter humicola]